ncbi:hypothetical protein HID58_046056 [Brassica napus]|uniref:Uncharacterized protein n=1 Tax=Brassica napus TaxID=3708 RepID=A0ABQ8AVH2_BRANA|nr:hypothetical protein HID58_046056 [Brassica napus]
MVKSQKQNQTIRTSRQTKPNDTYESSNKTKRYMVISKGGEVSNKSKKGLLVNKRQNVASFDSDFLTSSNPSTKTERHQIYLSIKNCISVPTLQLYLASRNHIFFSCSYSTTVWTHFSSGFGISPLSPSWDDIAHSLLSQSGSRYQIYLSILTWQATIYDIWWERNDRLHRGNHRHPDLLIKKISSTIKNRISALRPEHNSLASELIQLWFALFPT